MSVNIAYFGYSDKLLNILLNDDFFCLKTVCFVRHRVSEPYLNLIAKNSDRLKSIEIKTKEDLQVLEQYMSDVSAVIMYKFETIIPDSLLREKRFFNFHGGILATNRGAHAVVRSIVDMDDETALSLYELTGGIDLGILIGEYRIQLDHTETTVSLNEKLQEGIPLLLDDLKQYLMGKREGKVVDHGIYRKKITEQDYTLDLEKDSLAQMDAKLRSQVGYYGAICQIDGKDRRILRWNYEKPSDNDSDKKRTILYGNNYVSINDAGEVLCCFFEKSSGR